MKNYYTALLFEDRPDLHMTLKYYKDLDDFGIAELIHDTRGVMAMQNAFACVPFRLVFDREDWFGAGHNVRVLKLEEDKFSEDRMRYDKTIWPPYIFTLRSKHCNPHVSCEDKSLDVMVNAVAIMHKKTIVAKWDLKC